MNQDEDFIVKLPKSLKPWAAHHAERIGLPSPENYVLLVIRQAWQKNYLEVLKKACESNEASP